MKTKQITKVYTINGIHLYRLTNMEHSSKRYGPCEVCGEHVSDVHLQSEYVQGWKQGESNWKVTEDSPKFGHEQCLKNLRKAGKVIEINSFTLGSNTWTVGDTRGGPNEAQK